MGKSNFQLAGCCDADGGIPVTSSFRSTPSVLPATARRAYVRRPQVHPSDARGLDRTELGILTGAEFEAQNAKILGLRSLVRGGRPIGVGICGKSLPG